MTFPRIEIAGENALMVYFSDQPSENLTRRIMAVVEQVQLQFSDTLINCIPSYVSLLIIIDCENIFHHEVEELLQKCIDDSTDSICTQSQTHTLPVLYTENYCPDLVRVANHCGESIDTIIQRHTARSYHVYAMGFAPGFAYLGELEERLHLPRLATPRKEVPAGAVAIAESQTAIYPMASPGGWNVLGLCPLPLFTISNQPSTPFKVGDFVQFEAISEARFLALGGNLTAVEAIAP